MSSRLQFTDKLLLMTSLLSILLVSCKGDNQRREYEEVVIESPLRSDQNNPHALWSSGMSDETGVHDFSKGNLKETMPSATNELALSWEVPEGWLETKKEGMRMATFHSNEEDPIVCTIVVLDGDAGGQKANVLRWMQQLDMTVSDNQLNDFLKHSESIVSLGGYEARLYDFSQLQLHQNDQQPSIVSVIFNINERSVFVKMTGSKKAISKNSHQFKFLCQSLK